jgi:glycosyltransferase involved in cell wall biosynthesis
MNISVIMSVFNNAPYLRKAVESILNQTCRDFEFLIIDDGSTDGSSEILDTYASVDRRIRLLRRANKGLTASLNEAIAESRAPLIARMDGDDISVPTRLEVQKAFLDNHPDYGVVGCQATLIDRDGRKLMDAGDYPKTHAEFIEALEDRPLIVHPGVMMRRSLVTAIGGYRRAFEHGEDYDLWLRLSAVTKLCSVPETLLYYRHSPEQISSRHFQSQKLAAAIAWQAHLRRCAGETDPLCNLTELPPVEALDRIFGTPGVSRAVRSRVIPQILYSKTALRDGGVELIRAHLRDGCSHDGLWRLCLRLIKMGLGHRAVPLALALLRSALARNEAQHSI